MLTMISYVRIANCTVANTWYSQFVNFAAKKSHNYLLTIYNLQIEKNKDISSYRITYSTSTLYKVADRKLHTP